MTQTPEHDALPIEISVAEVKQLLDNQDEFLFIDCREQNENEFCRIEGTQLIPMNDVPSRVDELTPHQQSRVVVHCHHGARSLQVVNWLRSQGFAHAQNMTGGIDTWSQEIDQSVPRY